MLIRNHIIRDTKKLARLLVKKANVLKIWINSLQIPLEWLAF